MAENVPTKQEAIVNNGMAKGEQEYQELLGAVLKEGQRVLKKNGKLIFTFHHTKWKAWWTVLMAITSSGLRVADSFPVMSEYKVNPHIRNKQSLDMDLVLVCEKKGGLTEPFSLSPADILRRAMQELDTVADSSDNKLFLHFMGELLRTASAVHNGNGVNYDWFANALTHFDDFLETVERKSNKTKYEVAPARQLRLLETKKTKTLRKSKK